ncbi:MAG: YtxH domain-containing protein [bacterium]|nr:YtxH domain-containing protein [bacterium]
MSYFGDLRKRYYEPVPPPRDAGLLWVGLFLGVIMGVLVGVLLAPASGRVTRSRVRRRAEEVGDQLRESADDVAATGKKLVQDAETQVRSARGEVSRRLHRQDSEEEGAA